MTSKKGSHPEQARRAVSKDALALPLRPLYIRRLHMDEHRLKKIRLRAWRRGFREADLILGPFADKYCPAMTSEQLDAFEALMDEADQDIYDWYLGRSEAAAHIDPEIFALLKAFNPSEGQAGG